MSALVDFNDLQVQFPNLQLLNVSSTSGPQGPTGPTGPAGPQGPAASSTGNVGSSYWAQMYLYRVSSGATGGVLSSDTWTVRPLNATGGGNLDGTSTILSNNRIWLVPGLYYIEIAAVTDAFVSSSTMIRLYDHVTNSTLLQSFAYNQNLYEYRPLIEADGLINATGIRQVEIQHAADTVNVGGLGGPGLFTNAEHEVYTTIKIFRRT